MRRQIEISAIQMNMASQTGYRDAEITALNSEFGMQSSLEICFFGVKLSPLREQ